MEIRGDNPLYGEDGFLANMSPEERSFCRTIMSGVNLTEKGLEEFLKMPVDVKNHVMAHRFKVNFAGLVGDMNVVERVLDKSLAGKIEEDIGLIIALLENDPDNPKLLSGLSINPLVGEEEQKGNALDILKSYEDLLTYLKRSPDLDKKLSDAISQVSEVMKPECGIIQIELTPDGIVRIAEGQGKGNNKTR